jgi:hypothetical protein
VVSGSVTVEAVSATRVTVGNEDWSVVDPAPAAGVSAVRAGSAADVEVFVTFGTGTSTEPVGTTEVVAGSAGATVGPLGWFGPLAAAAIGVAELVSMAAVGTTKAPGVPAVPLRAGPLGAGSLVARPDVDATAAGACDGETVCGAEAFGLAVGTCVALAGVVGAEVGGRTGSLLAEAGACGGGFAVDVDSAPLVVDGSPELAELPAAFTADGAGVVVGGGAAGAGVEPGAAEPLVAAPEVVFVDGATC